MIPQQPCHHINCKKTYLKLYSTNDNNCINLTNNIKVEKFKISFCLFLKFFFQRETHLLAHYSSSFTRPSPNTTMMGDKFSMTPQRWKGFVRSMHPECLKIFMMQYLMTKSNPLQKKEETFENQGLWQSCIT